MGYLCGVSVHYRPVPAPLRIEDHALDMLLIDPLSTRNRLYALLYLKKNIENVEPAYLYSIAEVFGLREEVVEMMRFLESKTRGRVTGGGVPGGEKRKPDFMPSYDEFKRLCRLYGVEEP